jgi:ribonuclease VapC
MLLVNESSKERIKHYVLDSYAVLAYLKEETGHELVLNRIEEAEEGRIRLFMSLVNLGEVLYIVERERGLFKAQEVLALIDELPIKMELVDRELTLSAAHLKARYPIAYADCFAAALAQQKEAMLISGDPDFEKLVDVVALEWLPKKV